MDNEQQKYTFHRKQINCPRGHNLDDILEGFPFKDCDTCPNIRTDDDEGLTFCSEASGDLSGLW